MSAIDEKALEVAMIAYRTADYDRAHAPGPLQDVSVSVRTAIEAYLSATSSAATARIARLEEALSDLETIRPLAKAAFGGDWGVYAEEFGPHKGAVYIHANDVDADEDGLARDYGKRICEMADNDDDEANAAFIVACNIFVRWLLAKTADAALAGAR